LSIKSCPSSFIILSSPAEFLVLEYLYKDFAVLISFKGADQESAGDDAALAPLSILSNMQVKAPITEIPFFGPGSRKI